MLPEWLENLSAVALLALLAFALIGRHLPRKTEEKETPMPDSVHLNVTGMSCNHCVNSVTRALSEIAGVENVEVDLSGAKAVVTGQGLDAKALCAKVKDLGFEASKSGCCEEC